MPGLLSFWQIPMNAGMESFNNFKGKILIMKIAEINIRLATTADATLVADFSRETFTDSFAVYNTPANMDKFMNGPFSRERLMAETSDPDNIFLLAEQEGEIIGYVKMRKSEHTKEMPSAKAIEIARIYVAQRAIGKGVGKMLMEAAIQKAFEENKEILWLGVWEHNQRAIEFYTKYGFEQFGNHIFMLGDDAQTDLLMKMQIVK
jgi:ribosomal protein S18 acetylase RimI-like enzyme